MLKDVGPPRVGRAMVQRLACLDGIEARGTNARSIPHGPRDHYGRHSVYSPAGCTFGVQAGINSPDSVMQQSASGNSFPPFVWHVGVDLLITAPLL